MAFAILLFQDLAAIPLLALIPLLGEAKAAAQSVPPFDAVMKAVGMIALVVIGGRLLLRQLLRAVAWTQMSEVFTATSLLVVVGTAWLMQYGGLSMGLGAFLAGVLLADSEFRHEPTFIWSATLPGPKAVCWSGGSVSLPWPAAGAALPGARLQWWRADGGSDRR